MVAGIEFYTIYALYIDFMHFHAYSVYLYFIVACFYYVCYSSYTFVLPTAVCRCGWDLSLLTFLIPPFSLLYILSPSVSNQSQISLILYPLFVDGH